MSDRRPPKPPLAYRLVRDASGQSETFGVILLLAITVVGTTAVVTFGSQAMNDTERASDLQRVEQTMTLLDSRGAMVALGDSEQQSVDFTGASEGRFRVDQDSGWIAVTHRNYTEDPTNPKNEELYNQSMGALVYESGDTEIAYEGGGVWRVGDGGSARMVSKPEFHYRGATLTLPLIRMDGAGQTAGEVTVAVKSAGSTERQFPNDTKTYPATGNKYANPIKNGTVNVTVHSDYYRAWAEYFRSRTDSVVTVYDHNQTVTMNLLTLEAPGEFGSLSKSQTVAGFPEEHKITDYTTTVRAEKSNWKQIHWSWYVDKGSEKFELHVTPRQDADSCADVRDNQEGVWVTLMYENSSSGATQEWERENATVNSNLIKDVDCTAGDHGEITFDFTATDSGSELTYETIEVTKFSSCGNNNHLRFDDQYVDCGGEGVGEVTFDEHDDDHDPAVTYSAGTGQQETIGYLVNHYFALMGPSFELEGTQGPGNSNQIDEDESDGFLDYEQSDGQFLTYLHVSENEVRVEIR